MLKGCTIPEFVGAYDEFIGYFANVFSLVPAVKKSERAFSGMVNRLQFREITNTCLGYSSNGTRGNEIEEKLAKKIAESIIEIYDFGEKKMRLYLVSGANQFKFTLIDNKNLAERTEHTSNNCYFCQTIYRLE